MTGERIQLTVQTEQKRELRPIASWGSPILLAAAAALQITVAMGPMAGDLGNLQPLVWFAAALIGLAQCFFIAELAVRFPRRAGGTATYAHEAFEGRFRWLAALSGWSYWFAWTPGVAVNLILASSYLHATVAPHVNTVVLSLILIVVLYYANARGLTLNIRISALLIILAAMPLLVLLAAPVIKPSLFAQAHVWPLRFPSGHGFSLSLIVKWLFVAAWSAYGAEMSSTIFAECRTSRRTVVRGMAIAGSGCLVAFTLIPFVMTGIVGAAGLNADPATVFLVPAKLVLGSAGAKITGLMLASALIVGAQAYIISSSRTLYQMSRDGYMPRAFQRVNRFGAPFNTVICDAAVIALLVGIFRTNVVNVVASANIGYLVVFIILPLGFVIIRRKRNSLGESAVMPRWLTPLALLLAAFNACLLVVGAALWGTDVWLTGVAVLTGIIPLMLVRAYEDRGVRGLWSGPIHPSGDQRARTTYLSDHAYPPARTEHSSAEQEASRES